MRKEEIEILLNRYYEGTSTPEEEAVLKTYFTSPDVPEGYEAEKAIFNYFNTDVPEPSADFAQHISKGIDDVSKRRVRKIIYSVSAAAAMIILLISLVFVINSLNKTKDTFDDPQIAYAETMKILYSISAQLNKGREALEPVSKMSELDLQGLSVFNKSMKTLQNEMKNLQPLNEAIQLADTASKK